MCIYTVVHIYIAERDPVCKEKTQSSFSNGSPDSFHLIIDYYIILISAVIIIIIINNDNDNKVSVCLYRLVFINISLSLSLLRSLNDLVFVKCLFADQ